MFYVYWIHTPDQTDILSEGYVGISCQPDRRFKDHKKGKTNPHLTRAFAKYSDIVSTIVLCGSEDYCIEVETKLRPTENIGWNVAPGGGKPPSSKGKPKTQKQLESSRKNRGRTRSEDFKKFMSEIKTGITVGPCSETRKHNISEKRKGKVWYTNSNRSLSTCCYPGEEPVGWVQGQKIRKRPEPGLKRKSRKGE